MNEVCKYCEYYSEMCFCIFNICNICGLHNRLVNILHEISLFYSKHLIILSRMKFDTQNIYLCEAFGESRLMLGWNEEAPTFKEMFKGRCSRLKETVELIFLQKGLIFTNLGLKVYDCLIFWCNLISLPIRSPEALNICAIKIVWEIFLQCFPFNLYLCHIIALCHNYKNLPESFLNLPLQTPTKEHKLENISGFQLLLGI